MVNEVFYLPETSMINETSDTVSQHRFDILFDQCSLHVDPNEDYH